MESVKTKAFHAFNSAIPLSNTQLKLLTTLNSNPDPWSNLPITTTAVTSATPSALNLGGNGHESVYYLIVDLMNPNSREGALLELSKKREQWDDLALVLWHSFGTLSFALSPILTPSHSLVRTRH